MKKEIRVDVEEAVRRLKIVLKQAITTDIMGGYKSVFRGRGLEFDGYRQYAPDDDASIIDWKASARAKRLLVKTFAEERELEVFFLVDASESMLFGSTEKLKNEYSAEFVLSLSYLITEAGDKAGMAFFSDRVTNIAPVASGKKQFYAIARRLTNPEAYGGNYDITGALEFILRFLKKKGAILFVVSDFIGVSGDWQTRLKWLAAKFDVICVMVRDPRDTVMADAGLVYVEDPYTHQKLLIDPVTIAEDYRHYALMEEERITRLIKDANVDFLRLSTDRSFIEPLISLFKRRQARKWR